MDSQQYVHYSSCHPAHIKRNIRFNLARRVCTIVDDEESKIGHLNKLQVTLQNQGYPKWLVNSSITGPLKIPKQQLWKAREQKEDQKQKLCFVATHNPRNPDIFKIIKDTLNILHASPKMKKAIQNVQLINSKRQPPNLKKLLTRAKFVKDTDDNHLHEEKVKNATERNAAPVKSSEIAVK